MPGTAKSRDEREKRHLQADQWHDQSTQPVIFRVILPSVFTLSRESVDQNPSAQATSPIPRFQNSTPYGIYPTYSTYLLPVFPALTQLTLALRHPLAGNFGLPAILRLACAFPLLERLQITTEAEYNLTGPFNLPECTTLVPLAHLHTIHLNYPMLNARVLAYLAAPALEMLHLTLRSDSDSLHTCLRAAGLTLRTLVLCYPRDPLVIEIEKIDREDEVVTRDGDEGRALLSYMLQTRPRSGPSAFADRTGDTTCVDYESGMTGAGGGIVVGTAVKGQIVTHIPSTLSTHNAIHDPNSFEKLCSNCVRFFVWCSTNSRRSLIHLAHEALEPPKFGKRLYTLQVIQFSNYCAFTEFSGLIAEGLASRWELWLAVTIFRAMSARLAGLREAPGHYLGTTSGIEEIKAPKSRF
ncbi:hypothetical protein B0H13DRAFT_1915288 [Mycena leptocephala]|nr:hypothetical protein B0H13DRAFT_1915288 [Mycena leptocephala]